MKIKTQNKILEYKDIDDPFFCDVIMPACINNIMASELDSFETIYAAYNNVKYIIESQIPGDIVECGVWKGGMTQLAALTMIHLNDTSRNIYLYDTFEGMPLPDKSDIDWDGKRAIDTWQKVTFSGGTWGFGGNINSVAQLMYSTNYPKEKIIFVKGKVEETIPETIPKNISLLRLDTDFYQSTLHELQHLFPILVKGGVLVIDDYGYYLGARKACDEYFKKNKIKILLSRISNLGAREGVKF
jgi:O-methyltransferase